MVPWHERLPVQEGSALICRFALVASIAMALASASPAPGNDLPLAGDALPAPCARDGFLMIDKAAYRERLRGFWLGLSIGNWTGLVTEMDKIGPETGAFYTRDNWGGPDRPSIWDQGVPSKLSLTIDWVLRGPAEVWGADDDSDIEYIYLALLKSSASPMLTASQIRNGWLAHIHDDSDTPHRTEDGQPENFLWVSNQRAFDLMKQGLEPPLTGRLPHNEHYDMIDAQLTTELFGVLAPGRPDVALRLADLPIRTVADAEAADIARFYVHLHARAAALPDAVARNPRLLHAALLASVQEARAGLPGNQYPARMLDFVLARYRSGATWEETRDAVYRRYQVEQQDGYLVSGRNLYCNGCFAAGINFAASLISLLYGEGDMKATLQIAVLAGWDSDNPAATWGGLFGLLLGKSEVERQFGQLLSEKFDIHRTRKGFPDGGLTDFGRMADDAILVTERVVTQMMQGHADRDGRCWLVPRTIAR